MNKYNNKEFLNIINPILKIEEFSKLKNIQHHGISRYDHCMRVAYFTYKVSKKLHLHYKEATEAALLHDFFTDEVKEEKSIARLRKHPNFAVENAKKYFSLNDMQEDIIRSHMFPVTFTPPKYLESWLVDIVDDVAALYEKGYTTTKQLSTTTSFLFVCILQYLKMK